MKVDEDKGRRGRGEERGRRKRRSLRRWTWSLSEGDSQKPSCLPLQLIVIWNTSMSQRGAFDPSACKAHPQAFQEEYLGIQRSTDLLIGLYAKRSTRLTTHKPYRDYPDEWHTRVVKDRPACGLSNVTRHLGIRILVFHDGLLEQTYR